MPCSTSRIRSRGRDDGPRIPRVVSAARTTRSRCCPGSILLRLCVSVCVAADQQRQRPDDQYLVGEPGRDPADAARTGRGREPFAEFAMRNTRTSQILKKAPDPICAVDRSSPAHRTERQAWLSRAADHRPRLDAVSLRRQGAPVPRRVQQRAARRPLPSARRRSRRSEQMRLLNTNTRYLHDNLVRYARATDGDAARSRCAVCYFVNSGSEANELALRLARAHTRQQRPVIVLDAAYHGNTTTLVSIESVQVQRAQAEKARRRGCTSCRSRRLSRATSRADAGRESTRSASSAAIDELRAQRHAVCCGYIAESAPSVGGQIILPPGYLDASTKRSAPAGGVCIADEVQTAYGRLGDQLVRASSRSGVVPDIVVLGKPIGNGHPIGAVVTTAEIAASFDNGMEFFSTFGGNTVSCAAGLAVLDVMEDEHLQAHAHRVGDALAAGCARCGIATRSSATSAAPDSFFGVELVKNRETLEPAATEASTCRQSHARRGHSHRHRRTARERLEDQTADAVQRSGRRVPRRTRSIASWASWIEVDMSVRIVAAIVRRRDRTRRGRERRRTCRGRACSAQRACGSKSHSRRPRDRKP